MGIEWRSRYYRLPCPTFSDHVAALRYLLLVHGVSDIPHLAGGEVLEEVVVLDGLLDEVLGVEVLVDGGDGEGGAAGHALPRHSLLLVEGKLPRHTVAVLGQGSQTGWRLELATNLRDVPG